MVTTALRYKLTSPVDRKRQWLQYDLVRFDLASVGYLWYVSKVCVWGWWWWGEGDVSQGLLSQGVLAEGDYIDRGITGM